MREEWKERPGKEKGWGIGMGKEVKKERANFDRVNSPETMPLFGD